MIITMVFRVFDSLFPHVCLLCDQRCETNSNIDLCGYCRDALPWIRRACHRCGEPLPMDTTDARVCLTCAANPPPFDRTIAPLRLESYPRHWVHRLKYGGGLAEGRLLGTLLADHLISTYASEELPDYLVPVPLRWLRLAVRGHNQAVIIALPIKRALHIPLLRTAMIRKGHVASQQQLSRRARLNNLSRAFVARREFSGETIAVVDDVMTTGATAAAVASALLAAGAGSVHIWCPTRTLLS
ncbi:MAG: double zinc ribbon domain-containing protein [Gammaproteobacteria bacterium]|nr:double zinc ribbon domain-containing protein [Gammaproteobacteria bacterium]